jgi:hypothetical protein
MGGNRREKRKSEALRWTLSNHGPVSTFFFFVLDDMGHDYGHVRVYAFISFISYNINYDW